MSTESQRNEILRLFGDKFDIEFIEERRSAFVPDNRPFFDDMLAKLVRGEKHGLLAWHPDRLSRNEIDAARITYPLRSGTISDLQFCSYGFENSPEGIMHLQSALSHSQYESAKKSVDVKREMLQKCSRGWFPETAPNGYRNAKVEGYDEPIIVVDQERFALVRKAIDLILSRELTTNQARQKLNNEWGYRSLRIGKKGGGPISCAAWYGMLANKFYVGLFDWAGKEYKGSHPPMLTQVEFDELQRLIGRKGNPRTKKNSFAFSGAMVCHTCGYSIIFETKSKYVKSYGGIKSYTVAHCSHRSQAMHCPDRVNLNEEKLIDQIEQKVVQLEVHPLFLDCAMKTLDEIRTTPKSGDEHVKKMAEKSIQKARDGIRNLVRMRSLDQIDDDLFELSKADFEREIRTLEPQLVDPNQEREERWVELTRDTFQFATYALAKLSSGTAFEKKKVLIGLSESPRLHFGELLAEPNEWFVPIQEWNSRHKHELQSLEPFLSGSQTKRDVVNESLRLSWYSVIHEVRAVFERLGDPTLVIPNFSNPDELIGGEERFPSPSD